MKLLKVVANRHLSEGTFCLLVEKPKAPVRAGQCYSVGLREIGVNREYSIYSGADEEHLSFLIREIPDGIVSARLAQCKPGDVVEVGGPYGDFCLDEQSVDVRSHVFIASGTGIAPFHSFVRTFPNLRYQIFHGVRFEDEAYDSTDYAPNSYVRAVSRPRESSKSMRVTDLLQEVELDDAALYYLCGNQRMITDAIEILLSRGVHGSSIYTETFF